MNLRLPKPTGAAVGLLTLLLVAASYPAIEPDYGTGLDSSYVWGLNWLFDNDYPTLAGLVYPYGPLALLRLPVPGWHFALYLLFFTAAKAAFVALALAGARRGGLPLWLAAVALLPACAMGNVDTFVVLDVALLAALSAERRSLLPFAAGAALAALALTVKSSIGIQSCAVLFVGWLLCAARWRSVRLAAAQAATVAVALLAVGLAVYHSPRAMLRAYAGMAALTGGYAQSMVLWPPHRAWALALFVAAVAALLPLAADARARRMWLLLALPMAAAWKYGIVREDFWHFRQLMAFTACMVGAVLAAQSRFRWPAWACSAAALALLVVAIGALDRPDGQPLTTASPANVAALSVGFDDLNARSQRAIDSALATRRLPQRTLDAIGRGSVDCYPWEHLFAAANDLRWHPRPTVGAAFTPRLARLAADHCRSDAAADFIILHRTDFGADNGLRTVDGCYMPNDEPAMFDAMLERYEVADSGWYGLLLRRRAAPRMADTSLLRTDTVGFGRWVQLPADGAARRLAAVDRPSPLGRLCATLYKPDITMVDYLMPDGTVHTYRYSAAMAAEGLWVGPMPLDHNGLAALFAPDTATLAPTAAPDTATLAPDDTPLARPVAVRLRPLHPFHHRP